MGPTYLRGRGKNEILFEQERDDPHDAAHHIIYTNTRDQQGNDGGEFDWCKVREDSQGDGHYTRTDAHITEEIVLCEPIGSCDLEWRRGMEE